MLEANQHNQEMEINDLNNIAMDAEPAEEDDSPVEQPEPPPRIDRQHSRLSGLSGMVIEVDRMAGIILAVAVISFFMLYFLIIQKSYMCKYCLYRGAYKYFHYPVRRVKVLQTIPVIFTIKRLSGNVGQNITREIT